MNTPIKIAVIGGTGKSGQYLVKTLLAQGFHLRLLLRDPERFLQPDVSVEIVKGDARDGQAVLTLLEGCQAVISTLGQPKGEPSIFSQASRNILQAMHAHGISRYILTTGLHVNTPADQKSPQTRMATDWMYTHYPEITLDKQAEYELLVRSEADWTLVRLPWIELTEERKPMRASLEDCPGEKISATDLAHFLIKQLSDKTYNRQAPFIANV